MIQLSFLIALLLQMPFEDNPFGIWQETVGQILNVFYALAIRGYLILVLLGFMVYATGLSDGLGKGLVVFGIALYFAGPYLINLIASVARVETVTLETATQEWIAMLGMTDTEFISLLVTLGDLVVAICILVGAILYLTPTSPDLTSRGHSLIVRALMFAPILVFFHVAPFL